MFDVYMAGIVLQYRVERLKKPLLSVNPIALCLRRQTYFWNLSNDSGVIFNAIFIVFMIFCTLRGGRAMQNVRLSIIHPNTSFYVHRTISPLRSFLIYTGSPTL